MIKYSIWSFPQNLFWKNFISIILQEGADKRPSNDYFQVLQDQSACLPSPCPLPAPSHTQFWHSSAGRGWFFCRWGRLAAPTCKLFSPHQQRAGQINLKRRAGEGNQRGGADNDVVTLSGKAMQNQISMVFSTHSCSRHL